MLSRQWLSPESLSSVLIRLCVLLALLQGVGCTTTRTASGDIASESQKLELKAGDEIKIITTRRERFMMEITEVKAEGLLGVTVSWEASKFSPGLEVFVSYDDLAFIQLDKPSPAKTAGLVASVTFIGALIGAIAVAAPVPMVVP